MESVIAFLGDHQKMMVWVSVLSAVFFVGSILIIPILVARLPENYFLDKQRQPHGKDNPISPAQSFLVFIKNVIGILLIIIGILMLVLPGQGLITILIGLSMSNFPGKYTLERKLVSRPSIFRALNWIRKKTGNPALHHPG